MQLKLRLDDGALDWHFVLETGASLAFAGWAAEHCKVLPKSIGILHHYHTMSHSAAVVGFLVLGHALRT